MTIKDTHEFTSEQLKDLFLSVEWSSGHYPDRLVRAMHGYETVFSAWDEDRLIGMVCAMDDGEMTAYVHYMLIRPEYQGSGVGKALMEALKAKYKDYLRIVLCAYNGCTGFYEKCGFKKCEDETTMFITELWT